MERTNSRHHGHLASRSATLSMHRLTIFPLSALLIGSLAISVHAQSAPSAQPQAPHAAENLSPGGTAKAERANRHRVILLRVDEVIAADTDEGMDARLLPMGTRLESLFHFTTYRLVSRQVGRTECGRATAFTLPGGWIVHVEPNAVSDDMIAMELMLFQGARPMMTTDLRLKNHGMLIVGGPHYRQGMLIIPIGAEVPELKDSGPPAVSPSGSAAEPSERPGVENSPDSTSPGQEPDAPNW